MHIGIGQREIHISLPNKVLFPKDGITKGELIDDDQRIAPWMIPHLEGRPLAI
jgi:bifunctional non-homologous end joining protein LigD